MAQQLADMQREQQQALPPAPHWQEREPVEPREQSEVSRGIIAAMSHRAPMPASPPPGQARRATFATTPQPPAPLPLPIRPESEERYSPAPSRAALPGRLQDKLNSEIEREESVTPTIRNVLIAVSVVATIGIMLILMQRFGAIDVPILRGMAGTHASRQGSGESQGALTPQQTDHTAALIDSLKREVETAKQGSGVRPAAATQNPPVPRTRPAVPPVPGSRSSAPATNRGTAAPATSNAGNAETSSSASGDAPTTTPAPAQSTTHFGIGVVSYLDEERAKQESTRLATETVLPAVVMPYRDAGTTMYRVVIGRWTNVAEAERNANTLMERGVINEARVVTVPR
jgi:hypothetical protein